MTDSHQNDDHWQNLARRDVSDAEATSVGQGLDPDGPEAAAVASISALSRLDVRTLRQITSPESGWGDFREAHDALENIPDWGLGTVAYFAVCRRDVAYIKILNNVTHSMQATGSDIVGRWQAEGPTGYPLGSKWTDLAKAQVACPRENLHQLVWISRAGSSGSLASRYPGPLRRGR